MTDLDPCLDSFPHGCIVGLRISDRDRFLSCKESPFNDKGGTGVAVTLRDHCASWEHFRLVKRADQTTSLQNMGGGFLSPARLESGFKLTFRSEVPENGWERLVFAAAECLLKGALPKSFVVSVAGTQLYLDEECRVSHKKTFWEMIIVMPPVINLTCLGGYKCLQRLREQSPISLSPLERRLVLQLVRCMKDVGAFYVAGHFVPGNEEMLQLLKQAFGQLPFRTDAEESDDGKFKQNRLLCELDGSKRRLGNEVHPSVEVCKEDFDRLCTQQFESTENLCDALLHALAIGQELIVQEETHWRGKWRNDLLQYATLRTLAYHPGPVQKHDGSRVVVTKEHTDATWLTILRQDEAGGLEIRPPMVSNWIDARPPIPGTLLVNCGNVLSKASNGFYGAVCHRVIRTSDTATRVSLIFFYDRRSGDEYWAGGTLGC